MDCFGTTNFNILFSKEDILLKRNVIYRLFLRDTALYRLRSVMKCACGTVPYVIQDSRVGT
jgi:hypothetical protein